MSLLLKLYSSTLASNSCPMPINISMPFYEVTVRDLLDQIYVLLAVTYKTPYHQIKKNHIVVSVYYQKVDKYMNINNVKETTLLSELSLFPGSILHVQDSRLITNTKDTTSNKELKDVKEFVRADFKTSRSARASMISDAEDQIISTSSPQEKAKHQSSTNVSSLLSKTFLEESISQIDIIL